MPIHDWSQVPAGVFHDFHLTWIGRMRDHLNNHLLPERYYALAEPMLGEAIPDVIALEARVDRGEGAARSADDVGGGRSGAVRDEATEGAVALAPAPVIVQELSAERYPRLARRIAIHDSWEGDAVVSVLELVSSGNKTSRARADDLIRKRLGLLEKGIHLLLVDLHRPSTFVPRGFHARLCDEYGQPARELPPARLLSAAAYEVLEDASVRSQVAPLRVGDPLPEMPVFLLPGKFVRLPLETTYEQAFSSVPRKFRQVLAPAAGQAPT